MTAEAQWPLQQAIEDALKADAALRAFVDDRIYDDVPQGTKHPYVAIGDATAAEWDTDTTKGQEHTVTIHVWSRYAGQKEAKLIMAAINDVLDDASLALDGHALVLMYAEFSDVMRDPGGKSYHGVMRFRALTQAV